MSRVKTQKPKRRNLRRPRRAAKNKKRKSRASPFPGPVTQYLQLIRDPCTGPLVRSIGNLHTSAITERLRATYSGGYDGVSNISFKSSGFVVWFPSYHCDGAAVAATNTGYRGGNLYIFSNDSPSTAPSNASTTPFGLATGVAGVGMTTTGIFMRDPCHDQISNATAPFARATTVSACLQLDYIESLSAMKGQVAVVQNYSLASFVKNSGVETNVPSFPSVDEIFAHAANRQRLMQEGAEVIWRPTEESSIPRTGASQHAGYNIGSGVVVDAPFWCGSKDLHATTVVATNPNEVYGICIAWRGLPTSGVSINAVKVVDLELAARNSQIEEIRTGAPPSATTVTISSATNYLDRFHQGWQSTLGHGLQQMGSAAAMGAMHAANNATNKLLNGVVNGGISYFAKPGIRGSIMDRV